MMQARTILNALQEVDPANRSKYEANYKAFMAELVDLDADFKKIFAGRQGLRFMVIHPSWGYFADAYGLQQVPIESEGKEPSAKALSHLLTRAKADGVGAIFVQKQFSQNQARAVADAIGARIVVIDPLAEDYPENLRRVAQAMARTLSN